jgi:hypothetical protein
LNNNVKQILFKDKAEIIKKKSENWFYFLNKQGERKQYYLEPSLNFNREVVKRLKFFKEILDNIYGKSKK